jgi:hypothetical protein
LMAVSFPNMILGCFVSREDDKDMCLLFCAGA